MTTQKASSPSQARSFVTLAFFSGLNIVSGIGIQVANLLYFGTGAEKDAFDVAFFIPNLMIYLFGLDLWKGISTALFSRLAVNESEEGAKLFSSILTLLLVAGVVISVGIFVAAPWIVPLVAGGFDQERTELAVKLLRMMIPVLVLLNLTGFFDSILIAHHVYGWGSMSMISLKVAQLIAVVGFAPWFGIMVLPVGTVIGLAIAMAFQIYILRRHDMCYHWFYINLRSPKLREALWQAVPMFIGVIAVQLAMVVIQNVASRGEVGTIAALNYAMRLMAITGRTLVTPIYTSYAPRIARLIESREIDAGRQLTLQNLTWITYITWTGAMLVVLAADPVLRFLFQWTSSDHPLDVGRIAAFMQLIALLSWARGVTMLGIYLSLAKSAPGQVLASHIALAFGSAAAVLCLPFISTLDVAVAGAHFAGAVCSACVGVYWLHHSLGAVAKPFIGRLLAWGTLILVASLLAVAVGQLTTRVSAQTPVIIVALVQIAVALPCVLLLAKFCRLPEIDKGFSLLRKTVVGKLTRLRNSLNSVNPSPPS